MYVIAVMGDVVASIRTRKGSSFLFIDFTYMNTRCREKTNLIDTPANRKKLSKILERMEAEILLGSFCYERYFPKSNKVDYFDKLSKRRQDLQSGTPLFGEFVWQWFDEKCIEWRATYQEKLKIIIDKYLIPAFDKRHLSMIDRADVLAFRASLAKVTHKTTKHILSATRINSIMAILYMILKEASKRYNFDNPCEDIKQLKTPKSQIEPFSIDEVWQFIHGVRDDYKNYYIVRFFTGMRTSEIDGLTWEHVDFEKRQIKIRQALVNGVMGPPKTLESPREIDMPPFVYEALLAQKSATFNRSKFVFCTHNGEPLSYRNVNRRVWHPTLRLLGLKPHNAYQTRHTAATLWLSAGEAPEWIAKQMGHVNTMMLFKVYSRYVPNATRQDGSAFHALLMQSRHAKDTFSLANVPESDINDSAWKDNEDEEVVC